MLLSRVWAIFAAKPAESPVEAQTPGGRAYLIVTNEAVCAVTVDAGPVTVTPYASGVPITSKMVTVQCEGLKEAVTVALSIPGVDAIHFYSKKGYTFYKL